MKTITIEQAKVGDRIKFEEELHAYTIRARDDRFLICNKPFNCRKTVLYCIVDLEKQIRGPENLIFGMGAETQKQCEEMLERLTVGEPNADGNLGWKTEVSYRHKAKLKISWVKTK